MPPVLPRINFTDLKARASCFCAAEFRSNESNLAVHTKISVVPERRTSRRLQEWQQRLNLWNAIENRSRRAKVNCATSSGMKFQSRSSHPCKTVTRTIGWQTP